jgi:predicted transcriptional regulator/rubrerythrin
MKFEELLTAVRSAVATTLVRQHNMKPSDVARALGVSPATVTQYLKGRTGKVELLRRDPALWSRIEVFSEEVAKGIRFGLTRSWSGEVEELAMGLLREMKASPHQRPLDDSVRFKVLKRIELEERSAAKALELASKGDDPLLSMLLRQIASDSMRHADILTTLLRTLEGGAPSPIRDYGVLREMLAFEEQAESENLSELIRSDDPLVKALLMSVDLDERKHEALLRELMEASTGKRGTG